MTQTEIAPRPTRPAGTHPLFELIADGEELIAAGTREQMEWDAADALAEAQADGDYVTTYTVVEADLEGCERGARGEHCDATTHALHGVPADERPAGY